MNQLPHSQSLTPQQIINHFSIGSKNDRIEAMSYEIARLLWDNIHLTQRNQQLEQFITQHQGKELLDAASELAHVRQQILQQRQVAEQEYFSTMQNLVHQNEQRIQAEVQERVNGMTQAVLHDASQQASKILQQAQNDADVLATQSKSYAEVLISDANKKSSLIISEAEAQGFAVAARGWKRAQQENHIPLHSTRIAVAALRDCLAEVGTLTSVPGRLHLKSGDGSALSYSREFFDNFVELLGKPEKPGDTIRHTKTLTIKPVNENEESRKFAIYADNLQVGWLRLSFTSFIYKLLFTLEELGLEISAPGYLEIISSPKMGSLTVSAEIYYPLYQPIQNVLKEASRYIRQIASSQ